MTNTHSTPLTVDGAGIFAPANPAKCSRCLDRGIYFDFGARQHVTCACSTNKETTR